MAQAAPIEYQGAALILGALGIAPTSVNVNLIVAQEINEWGWQGTLLQQSLNPLATTLYTPQAVRKWNSVGVWVYSSLAAGAQACAKTLQGYPTMLQALRTSNASLYFGSTGRAELYKWSGGSATYANDLQTYYGQLSAVPSAYLAAQQTAAPQVATFVGQSAPYAIAALIGGALTVGGVLLLEQSGKVRL